MTPRATYRVQFHEGFTFADAAGLAPYWSKLGISHLYASPIAVARAGSTHGYDVVDPTRINPALGGADGFEALVAALRREGLGVILDIVPNHVAVGGADNAWWLDVLESGPTSRFARYFDIDWAPPDPALHGRLLAPFLGAPYAEALAAGDLRLDLEPQLGRLSVMAYGAHRFPLRRADYADVLAEVGADSLAALDVSRLQAHFAPETAEGRERLHALMERQVWRLAEWTSAGDMINWRRFFDITELAGLRVEDEAVFDAVHALPLDLYARGLIDGLRVDHVDGLADPGAYCRRLRARLEGRSAERPSGQRERAYLVVEKILGAGEALPDDWEVDGTTGYEFMNEVSALLHAPQAQSPLLVFWGEATGRPTAFEDEEDAARAEMLERGFAGQVDAAAATLRRLGETRLDAREFGAPAWRRAVKSLVTALRVYRTYGASVSEAPNDHLQIARRRAIKLVPTDAAVLDALVDILSVDRGAHERTDAVRRFEQLSAPIAAKAVEDTAFYRHGPLLSRNDVGFDPGRLSASPEAFLALCGSRGDHFPAGMLATATHDHKRGEDVRARLSMISEAPEAWMALAEPWLGAGRDAGVAPSEVLMLVQTLVGAWPLDLMATDTAGLEAFRARVEAWQVKALREAKLESSWRAPNLAYEQRCADFLRESLSRRDACWDALVAFVEEIAPAGVAKSLAQTGLKLTLPGVPDIYQGAEGWDFSLVDPDNRRPVDYVELDRALERPSGEDWRAPARKQRLVRDLLQLRRRHPALFQRGELRPLRLSGHRADEAIAFQRVEGDLRLTVIAAIRTWAACRGRAPDLPIAWWEDTAATSADGQVFRLADICGVDAFSARLGEVA